jgi:tetratricopeptide (TPR) repeat protein/predicted Ser/Thr protein kinase
MPHVSAGSEPLVAERAVGSPQELALVTTLPAPQASIDGAPLPVPDLDGVADIAERDRVFTELFQIPAERQRLGRYVVLGTLGRGAMGTVLEAFDRTVDRPVAVKVLHRELAQRYRARLIREARALAKLSHPHVVQVYEVGEADGQVFITMELVRGRSLWDWMQQDPRPSWRECVKVYLQAGEGLAAAHAEGLVHRDFKPSNVVIDDKGRVRVLDFGLARQAEDIEQGDHVVSTAQLRTEDPTVASSLTRTGTVLGTPAYMSLEQLAGRRADARSDQFSYCVSLYEALYGERPFGGRSMEALMLALEEGKIRPASKGVTVPEALRKLVLRGLAIDPCERWTSMEALLTELRRLVAPRRRAWWALAVAGGLLAMGLGLAQYAKVGFRCEGAKAQLDGVWDEARKQEVREAILATGLAYAPDTWVRVEQHLGEYAGAWADKYKEVCEATSVRQEQTPEVMDLRMECLRSRKVALREAVGVLAEADAMKVEKAVELVTSLPGLLRCDNIEALAAELPPPEDPEVAAQVEVLREWVAQVRALTEAGGYDEALAEAEAVVEAADGLAYPPLLAEALLERSKAHTELSRLKEAEQDAERAYVLAAEHGHGGVEARAANHLAKVGRLQARHEAGLHWGKTALALARGRRLEPELEADSLDNIGDLLRARAKLEDALTHYQRALAIREEVFGPRHPVVAESLDNIGGLLGAQEELEEALTHHQRALAIREEVFGPRHPVVAESLDDIGRVLRDQGKLVEASMHLQRGLAIREEEFGSGHPDVAVSLVGMGDELRAQGDMEEALIHYQRALAIREEVFGPHHPSVARALSNIGTVLITEGKLEEALTHYQRASVIFEEALGPRHPHAAGALANIGSVLRAQGKLADAVTHYQRASVALEKTLGPHHPNVAVLRDIMVSSLIDLADAALAKDDSDGAREHAEHAVSICEAGETSSERLADARFVLARALWTDPSQRSRSRMLAEQAHDAYVGLARPEDVASDIEQWLDDHRIP